MNSTECVYHTGALTIGIDVDGKVLNENYHSNTMLAWRAVGTFQLLKLFVFDFISASLAI